MAALFPKVFRDNGGFDIVIGNPPYISATTQVANETLAKNRAIIAKSKRFKTLYQKWDLYIPFMELGLQLIRKNGIMTMIVPYPLTNQIYAQKLRDMFVAKYNLLEVVDLNDVKIFEATVQNCIPFVKKSKSKGRTIISNMVNGQISHIFIQPHEKLVQNDAGVWNLTMEERNANAHVNMHVLGDYCYISVGMVLNADEKVAKGEFVKKDLISETYDTIHCKQYIEGKDIDSYVIKRIRYLEWNTYRCPSQLRRPTFPELYTTPKVLINALGEMKATIDEKGEYYCEQQVRMAVLWKDLTNVDNKSIASSVKKYSALSRSEMEKLSEQVSIKYLVGILNSSYAARLLTNLRSGDYHIVPEYIRNIPIPNATPEEQAEIIRLVDIALKEKTEEILKEIDDKVQELYEKEKGE